MNALGYNSSEDVTSAVKKATSVKEGSLMWDEFLDFFFLRQANLQQKGFDKNNNWWRKIGQPEVIAEVKASADDVHNEKVNSGKKANVPRYGASSSQQQQVMPYNYEDPDKKQFKMTENLKMLQNTRKGKVEQEVEEEFKVMHQQKLAQKSLAASTMPVGAKKKVGWEASAGDEDDEEQLFGFKREKSECMLLKS